MALSFARPAAAVTTFLARLRSCSEYRYRGFVDLKMHVKEIYQVDDGGVHGPLPVGWPASPPVGRTSLPPIDARGLQSITRSEGAGRFTSGAGLNEP
jgi:hypothetical protein